MQGTVLEVTSSPYGDELAVDHLTGATTLILTDVTDFDEDEGTVVINGTVYDYVGIDRENNQMTLATGLVEDLQYSEKVNLSPLVIEKWAMVEVKDDDDVILALVPHSLYDKLEDGVREPEDQEPVNVQTRDGDWYVADIVGSEPKMSAAFIDPGTMPNNPLLDELAAQVAANTDALDNTNTVLENLEETTQAILDQTLAWDGRVNFSDYEPGPEDIEGRTEGSIWFTRTRARINLCSNPTFEVGVTDWSTSELTMARVADAAAISGSHVLELTNTTVAGNHVIIWDNGGGAAKQPVVPGASYTWSIFAKLMSGSGVGVFARIQWYDASDVPLSPVDGPAVGLLVNDWLRPYVQAVAPDTAAYAVAHVVNPNISDVWRIDGGLFEQSDMLGRYFDGRSYDAKWGSDGLGTPDDSISVMAGGKIVKVFELDDSSWVEKKFTGATLADLDASQITQGFMDGERLQDNSIPIDKLSGVPVPASEALTAGQLVNIYSDAGVAKCRLADASNGRPCHGFVLASVAADGIAVVLNLGYNPLLSGMEVGERWLSSTTPGGTTRVPPSAAGTIVQQLGFAVGETVLQFSPNVPIWIV